MVLYHIVIYRFAETMNYFTQNRNNYHKLKLAPKPIFLMLNGLVTCKSVIEQGNV